jgi:hypothetical protein
MAPQSFDQIGQEVKGDAWGTTGRVTCGTFIHVHTGSMMLTWKLHMIPHGKKLMTWHIELAR